jgi:hypothetical protein
MDIIEVTPSEQPYERLKKRLLTHFKMLVKEWLNKLFMMPDNATLMVKLAGLCLQTGHHVHLAGKRAGLGQLNAIKQAPITSAR